SRSLFRSPSSGASRHLLPGGEGTLLRTRWRQRGHVRGDRKDVVVCQLLHRLLHQLRVGAVSESILEQIQLSHEVDRMNAGDARHIPQSGQRISMAERACDSLALLTVL